MKNLVSLQIPEKINICLYSNILHISGPVDFQKILYKSKFSFIFLKKKNLLICCFSLSNNKNINCKNQAQLKKLITEIKTVIKGLLVGHFNILKLSGVGYRFLSFKENILTIKIGFSHNIYVEVPPKIQIFLVSPIKVSLFSSNLKILTQTISNLKKVRKKDVYKGKGLSLESDKVLLKEFKKK